MLWTGKNLERRTGRILSVVWAVAMPFLFLTGCAPHVPATVVSNSPSVVAHPAPSVTPAEAVVPIPSPSSSPHPTFPVPTFTPQPTPVPGKVFVDASRTMGKVSPMVFGTNVGPWQYLTRSMRPYVLKANFGLLRFPGGNWGDEYMLTHEQLDKFVELCRKLGAQPLVQVKLFQGEPEDAAELVRYANVVRQYGIVYWNIGNEPDLYAVNRGEQDYTTRQFGRDWRDFADAMRSVDPSIRLVGPEIAVYTGTGLDIRDRQGKLWMEEFLRSNGDDVDVVSFHWYPFGKPGASRETLLLQPPEWDDVIGRLRADIRRYTGRDIPIGVTEVNSDWTGAEGGEATPDSFYNALWWADVLGRLIRQRVFMVGQFALSGAGGLGLLSLEGPRPTYYVYLLYRHFGDTVVYASSPNPMVPVYAARGKDTLSLLAVNETSEELSLPLSVAGARISPRADFWRLEKDGWHQGESEGDALSLPPYSATMFQWHTR